MRFEVSKTIILLHGALGSQEQLQPLKERLKDEYDVHTFNFSGHGGSEVQGAFSIQKFAEQVLHFCEANKITNAAIFGYSMGGYVALYLARHYPALVLSVITLGTKLHWDEATAAKETAMMNPGIIEQKVPAFAKQLATTHQPVDWKGVMNKTAEMLTTMGKSSPLTMADYQQISANVLLMLGDRDKMVTMDETTAAYKALSNAQMAILPGTPHAIEQGDVELISYLVKKFTGL